VKIVGEDLEEVVSRRLRGHGNVVVCGVGNDLRADDGVGLLVAECLEGSVPGDVSVIRCGEVPENFIGEIVSRNPTHLIIIDAAHVSQPPGTIVIVEADDISPDTLSTHRLPLSFFASVVSQMRGGDVDVFTLAVQIRSTGFGEEMSPEVVRAANALCKALRRALGRTG